MYKTISTFLIQTYFPCCSHRSQNCINGGPDASPESLAIEF